ncbi:hypothetical protein [Mucilaginibacter arboris]|uniref:Uncharacterized protein n=1 Tax=Mucilaginibacter arboris TaxID=2682090 RepID=A0A7K1SYC9_9SPHI|nr:hypothetical protein [Mucilaginibacter arboris]MVN22324.1 hypothetical protein [Mucilaginibacter arboris]
MTNSSLEIKDSEYLIKFSKQQFDIDFVKSILAFINQKLSVKEASTETGNVKDAEDNFYKDDYFSHLDEK